jgi:hypothetical protein
LETLEGRNSVRRETWFDAGRVCLAPRNAASASCFRTTRCFNISLGRQYRYGLQSLTVAERKQRVSEF